MTHIFQIHISNDCDIYVHSISEEDVIEYSAIIGQEMMYKKVKEKVAFVNNQAHFLGNKHLSMDFYVQLKNIMK